MDSVGFEVFSGSLLDLDEGQTGTASPEDVRSVLLEPPLKFQQYVVDDILRACTDAARSKTAAQTGSGQVCLPAERKLAAMSTCLTSVED